VCVYSRCDMSLTNTVLKQLVSAQGDDSSHAESHARKHSDDALPERRSSQVGRGGGCVCVTRVCAIVRGTRIAGMRVVIACLCHPYAC
jgi:hypothetical protein